LSLLENMLWPDLDRTKVPKKRWEKCPRLVGWFSRGSHSRRKGKRSRHSGGLKIKCSKKIHAMPGQGPRKRGSEGKRLTQKKGKGPFFNQHLRGGWEIWAIKGTDGGTFACKSTTGGGRWGGSAPTLGGGKSGEKVKPIGQENDSRGADFGWVQIVGGCGEGGNGRGGKN